MDGRGAIWTSFPPSFDELLVKAPLTVHFVSRFRLAGEISELDVASHVEVQNQVS